MPEKMLQKLVDFLKSQGASKIILFGSYASGKQKKTSDVDVIVRFKEPKSLFDLAGIEIEASDHVGKKVDLLTEGSISPYFRESIYRTSKVLFG